MSNLTLSIKSCKIHGFRAIAANHAFGRISWKENGFDFEKSFFTNSIESIALLDLYKHEDISFSVTGSLVKKKGTGEHAGKIFENVVLTEVNLNTN